MFKYVLSMILFGGLLGGGLIGGCGEDKGDSPLPSEGEGQGEGEGEGSQNEGEGEGSTEGEGEDPMPPGADGEPCGDGNTCQDGLECGAEEAGICTCPQWFEGTWWAEFANIRATDGHAYDFTKGSGDRELWASVEIAIDQQGCTIIVPESRSMFGGRSFREGKIDPPPLGFWFKRRRAMEDGREGFVIFSGRLSEDHQIISGECAGEYDDVTVSPGVFFHIACEFTLTRRE